MNLTDATEEQLRAALELKEAEKRLQYLSQEGADWMKAMAPDLCRKLDEAMQLVHALRRKITQ